MQLSGKMRKTEDKVTNVELLIQVIDSVVDVYICEQTGINVNSTFLAKKWRTKVLPLRKNM